MCQLHYTNTLNPEDTNIKNERSPATVFLLQFLPNSFQLQSAVPPTAKAD